MIKQSQEWLKQADYDIATAAFLAKGGRYFYAVFMCHLSIEKALKGLVQHKLNEEPKKVHNLIYLINKIGITPPENIGRFLVRLNEGSVVTRYPEDLAQLGKNFTRRVAQDIMANSKEALKWIKGQF